MTSLKSKTPVGLALMSSAVLSYGTAFAAEPSDLQTQVRQWIVGNAYGGSSSTMQLRATNSGSDELFLDMQQRVRQLLLGERNSYGAAVSTTTGNYSGTDSSIQYSATARESVESSVRRMLLGAGS